MHVNIKLRHASKWLMVVTLATLLGWAGWERAGSAQAGQSPQVSQAASSQEALRAAREALDTARANLKNHHITEAARALEEALASYNAAAAARANWIQERLKELELDPPALAQGEPQELRAELQTLAHVTAAALSPAGPLLLEVEPNDTTAQAMAIDAATSPAIVLGAVSPISDRDFFKFNAPAGAKVWAYVDTGGTVNTGSTSRNSLLTLYAADGTTVIEEDDDDGTGNGCDGTQETVLASAIAGRTLTAGGTYYLRVQQFNNGGVINPYTIYVALTNVAATAESEPNNDTAQANPIIAAGQTGGLRSGAISPAGDVDVYSVVANANDILYISTDDDPERDGAANDSVVQLLSPAGTVLLTIDNSDDEGFPAPPAEAACFLIPSAGTYFVRVRHFSSTGTGTYNLMVAIAGQRRTDCATVTAISPTSGAPGTSVTLAGTELTGVTGVTFPNNVTATFTVVNDTTITTTVPAGAVSGQLTINKTNCLPARSPYFIVPGTNCPTVTAISPNNGFVGSPVTITGTNLAGVTAVRFANNVNANFNIASDTQISASIPAGAVTGPISIVRADCPVAQTASFTVNAGQELAVDDDTFETNIGLSAGGTESVVNRLTPTSYPSTLSRVSVFLPSGGGVVVGTTIGILVGVNPGGGTNIDNTQFQVTQATVQALGQFNVYSVPAVTINSGDFVVGFSITHASGVFPDAIDRTPPSQMRSYLSSNGTTFLALDSIGSGAFAGNFGIRARLAATIGTLGNVSAASFLGTELARDSIVAVFGASLATTTQVATGTPLPTAIAGTTVKVRDSAGIDRLAPLFFVAPGQINYLIPSGTALGTATVTITSGDGAVSVGTIQIVAVAPGLFSANSSGADVAAAVALRIRADGAQIYEPVYGFDTAIGRNVAVPIDLGPATDQVFLILYGGGIRGRSALSAVTVQVGGTNAPVSFAGDPGGFLGLDQVNVLLSRDLVGRGSANVVLMVDGKTSNTVTVNIR